MRVIAVVNQKGGVGKTTTAVNLGAALALRGRRVLLVDMDPQGNLTEHLLPDLSGDGGGAPGAEVAAPLSVYDVLIEGKPVMDAVVETSTRGLFVLPSHEDLAGAELDLASVIGREVLLRDALADVAEAQGGPPFDYVLVDCPPSLGLLSLNALAAADEVFIALQTEFFAMRGLGALDRTVDLVRRRINPGLSIGGIVPTLVDVTRLSREVMDEVRSHYGEKVFATRIRSSVRLAEAPSHQKHVFDYAPDSPGAEDYAALAKEVEEGRAAVTKPVPADAVLPTPSATAPAPPGATRPGAPVKRGIAGAIAAATAAVATGATPPTPSKSVPPPPRERVAPSPSALAAAASLPPSPPSSAPPHVALPVIREAPRPIYLPPMPIRAASKSASRPPRSARPA